ncbi:MAG: ABC transporter substrate-binding protein [Actinomycetota bacterium]|nr:ABC transporter substrate-binding protein [Actinomycetota bacterium]
MGSSKIARTLAVSTVVLSVALAGCSTKASTGTTGGASNAGGVKTDVGVTDKDITLGNLTDLSGVFKTLGLGITQGTQIWAEDVNAKGGICGRQIKITSQDHGYSAEKAVPLYNQSKGQVLGYVQLLGSPILAALKKPITDDKVAVVPSSWASSNLDVPEVVMVGTTYDVEMVDGLSYLMEKGKIKEGDTLGHIYVDSEYGKNGLKGSTYFAKEHNMKIVEAAVTSTDSDLTSAVTQLKSAGVKAILLTTTPAQTASAVGQAAAQGLNVPVFGNNPTFTPQLLQTPAKAALTSGNFITVAGIQPFSSDAPVVKDIATRYKAKYTDTPTFGPLVGYTFGQTWGAILKTACDAGDLTRQGILDARAKTKVDTGGLAPSVLDFTNLGSPSTRAVWLLKPAEVEGGLSLVQKDPYTSKEAESYKTPFQK